ncbi:MAG: nitronate monooxygenase [Calditrichia bacterium]|nr:nitronate monooxygenase [Calditrichia bacterium]
MDFENIPKLKIGNLVAEKPIIQGGMGVGVSMAKLASAVANEGGIGVISSVGLGLLKPDATKKLSKKDANKEAIRKEIRLARKLTDGILGLNVMVALTDYDDILKIAFEEEIDIVFVGAGLPLKLPKDLPLETIKNGKTKIGVIVSSGRAANLIFQVWKKNFNHVPDAVVVEVPLAGGHLGFKKEQIDDPNFALEKILPEVIKAVKPFEEYSNKEIPVIAAGGIYTGADIKKYLDMGAKGVQMGTRFVATHECDASDKFKQSYIDSKKEDIVIIQSPVGLPGRTIRNAFIDDVSAGEKKPFKCLWKCLKTCDYKNTPYCIAIALINAQQGKLEDGFTFAGANAYRVNEIVSVKELFEMLENEYNEALMPVS